MKKVMITAIFIACCASISFAQTSSTKVEGAVSFSVDSIDTGLGNNNAVVTNVNNRLTGYGFDTSVTGYFNNKFGIEGDFDGHFRGKTLTLIDGTTANAHLSSYNFMAGPHVRFTTSNSKVSPYVHALFGGNYSKERIDANTFTGSISDSQTKFAMKLGGGFDFGISPRAGIRVGADYNPVFNANNNNVFNNGSSTRNDFLFNVGIVFK